LCVSILTQVGIWTLIFATFVGVERFTFKKLFGVLASFAGIILTSSVDISGSNDANRGTFPHKSSTQIAVGDVLALISAVIYGVYATTMKKKIGDESKVNMPLFFGFVGLFGMIVLLPGFPLLHYTGVEKFQLPPTRRVIVVILVSSHKPRLSQILM
jgi:solute carrier family 35 protein F5